MLCDSKIPETYDVRSGEIAAAHDVSDGKPVAHDTNDDDSWSARRADAEMARRLRAEVMEQLQTEMKLMRNSQQRENEALKAQLQTVHHEVSTLKAGTRVCVSL